MLRSLNCSSTVFKRIEMCPPVFSNKLPPSSDKAEEDAEGRDPPEPGEDGEAEVEDEREGAEEEQAAIAAKSASKLTDEDSERGLRENKMPTKPQQETLVKREERED